ncbi:MAG: hypothetical protein ACI9U2_003222 [Bradymonadia bacterium]|jgi:hypothetical protein
MCRSILTVFNFEPRAAALQYARKLARGSAKRTAQMTRDAQPMSRSTPQ